MENLQNKTTGDCKKRLLDKTTEYYEDGWQLTSLAGWILLIQQGLVCFAWDGF